LASEMDRVAALANRPEGISPGVGKLRALGVHVKRVERPASEPEARQILSRAFKEKLTVFPCGGGTSLGAGVLPESVDVALDTSGMNRVLAFDSRNLTLAILSGMTLNQINEYLGGQEKGFFLPLDPPLPHLATLGGIYAANASGPSRLRYGTIRDQVLGVRGADAGGREVGFGGKTVKNVSGYDLTKFFIGSAGSLCLITSLSFRVCPLPEASSLCDLIFETLEELEKFLPALRSSVLLPSAAVVTELAGGPGVSNSIGSRFRVWVGFEGDGKMVERQNKDLLKLAEEYGGMGKAKIDRAGMIQGLRSATDPDEPVEDSILKISVPMTQGPRAYVSIGKMARRAGLEWKAILFPGNGLIYFYFREAGTERMTQFIQELKNLGQAAGGYVTPVRAHRNVLSSWGPRVQPGFHQSLFQPIKERLDPTGVFPPII
jgi:glycolate oxidase FAD binding subunit